MITKQTFGFIAECDSCSSEEDMPDAESFQEAVNQIKGQGWNIRKVGNDWTHVCPSCLQDDFA
jgi:hypothetical protein